MSSLRHKTYQSIGPISWGLLTDNLFIVNVGCSTYAILLGPKSQPRVGSEVKR